MSSGQPLVCNWSRHIQRTSTCRATCVWRRREPGRSPRMDSGQPCDWPFLVIIAQIWAVACFNVPLQSRGDPGESWKKSSHWMIWGGAARRGGGHQPASPRPLVVRRRDYGEFVDSCRLCLSRRFHIRVDPAELFSGVLDPEHPVDPSSLSVACICPRSDFS